MEATRPPAPRWLTATLVTESHDDRERAFAASGLNVASSQCSGQYPGGGQLSLSDGKGPHLVVEGL